MRGNSEFTGNITVPATGLLFKTNGTLIKSGAGTLSFAAAGASTITVPTATDTMALLGTAQTFTAAQSFGAGFSVATAQTVTFGTVGIVQSSDASRGHWILSAANIPGGNPTGTILSANQQISLGNNLRLDTAGAWVVPNTNLAGSAVVFSADNAAYGKILFVSAQDTGGAVNTVDILGLEYNKITMAQPTTFSGGFAAQTISGAVTWSGAQTFSSGITVNRNTSADTTTAIFGSAGTDAFDSYVRIRGGSGSGGESVLYFDRNTTADSMIYTATSTPGLTLRTLANTAVKILPNSSEAASFTSTAATIGVPLTQKVAAATDLTIWSNTNTASNARLILQRGAASLGSDIYTDYIFDTLNGVLTITPSGTAATTVNSASFSLADTGAVTIGSSAGGVNHTINGGLLLPSSGATASALNFYATTTFTFAWTPNGSGSTASSNVTAVLTRIGNLVSLTIPNSTDAVPAGTTTYLSYSSLPAWARPSTTRSAGGVFPVRNNSTMAYTGAIEVDSSGVVYLFRDQASTAFTNAAGAGTGRVSLTWLI
jgi:hypothetical protein